MNNKGRQTKVPYRADSPSIKASSTDPQTWADYHSAVATVSAGCAHGIGFALYGGTVGAFDLDHCRNRETGEIAPWALWLLKCAGSYAEITPSGEGLRILGVATGHEVHRSYRVPTCNQGVVEIYRRAKRYITISGNALAAHSTAFTSIDAAIDWAVEDLDSRKHAIEAVDGRLLLNKSDVNRSEDAQDRQSIHIIPPRTNAVRNIPDDLL